MDEKKKYVMPGPLFDQLSPEANIRVHRLFLKIILKNPEEFMEPCDITGKEETNERYINR